MPQGVGVQVPPGAPFSIMSLILALYLIFAVCWAVFTGCVEHKIYGPDKVISQILIHMIVMPLSVAVAIRWYYRLWKSSKAEKLFNRDDYG